jgi:threonyl-tRNA synthetase
MAQAVVEMFPGEAKVAIGPPIAEGFYYDFDLPRPIDMHEVVGSNPIPPTQAKETSVN